MSAEKRVSRRSSRDSIGNLTHPHSTSDYTGSMAPHDRNSRVTHALISLLNNSTVIAGNAEIVPVSLR